MDIQVLTDFEDADANSLKIELFRDDDRTVCGWYIGPLIKMAKEFVLPFTPRDQNLRAETAIVRVVEIALAADLPVALIDPDHLWDELSFNHGRTDPFSALLDPSAEERRPRRRRRDLITRDRHAAEPRRRDDPDIRP